MGAVLVSSDILKQVGSDQIAHTPRSLIFVGDNPAGSTYQMAYALPTGLSSQPVSPLLSFILSQVTVLTWLR